MARALRKVDKLQDGDLADAPAGQWKKVIDSVNDLVESHDQLRDPGLLSRVDSSKVRIDFSTTQDWWPVIIQPDWTTALSGVPFPPLSVRKYDDGMAELRGCIQWQRVAVLRTAAQLPFSYMYPDYEYTQWMIQAPPTSALWKLDAFPDGYMRLDSTGPAAAAFLMAASTQRWQCADPTPPPHLTSPILVEHGLDGPCTFVGFKSLWQGTQNNAPIPLPRLSWFDKGNGKIQINNILGLPGGMSYHAELVCIGE